MVTLHKHCYVWGASRIVLQKNGTVYIQQQQHQFGRLSFAYVDWSVSTDLISLWYLELGCTRFHVCPTCLWEEVLSLQGTSTLSDVLSGNKWVYRYEQPYQYTVPPVKHTGETDINHQQYRGHKHWCPVCWESRAVKDWRAQWALTKKAEQKMSADALFRDLEARI